MQSAKIAMILAVSVFLLQARVHAADAPERITPSFKEADLGLAAEAVTHSSGRNIVVDPDVCGQISLTFESPVTGDEFYEAFVAAVRDLGYIVVVEESVTRISSGPNTLKGCKRGTPAPMHPVSEQRPSLQLGSAAC